MLTLTYSTAFVAYVDGISLGQFEVDTCQDQPDTALIGLPWLNGWGPAPMALYLHGSDTKALLLPVKGEENLSYNSKGYFRQGPTGNTCWMELSLSGAGISFRPCDSRPAPQTFWFIGFSKE